MRRLQTAVEPNVKKVHMNQSTAINWKILYRILAVVFLFPFSFSFALYLANSNLSLFLASCSAFSIIFVHLFCGIKRAETARFSFSNPPTATNYNEFFGYLSGGFWVSTLTFIACIVVPMLIIIVI